MRECERERDGESAALGSVRTAWDDVQNSTELKLNFLLLWHCKKSQKKRTENNNSNNKRNNNCCPCRSLVQNKATATCLDRANLRALSQSPSLSHSCSLASWSLTRHKVNKMRLRQQQQQRQKEHSTATTTTTKRDAHNKNLFPLSILGLRTSSCCCCCNVPTMREREQAPYLYVRSLRRMLKSVSCLRVDRTCCVLRSIVSCNALTLNLEPAELLLLRCCGF